jgi:hypothetical protein
MGKLSRMKGANYEREVARWLNLLMLKSTDFKRNVTECQQGNKGDVIDLTARHPLVGQCKHRKKMDVRSAMKEAEEAAEQQFLGSSYYMPLAFCKWHGGEEIIAMRRDTLGPLLIAAEDYEWRSLCDIYDGLV